MVDTVPDAPPKLTPEEQVQIVSTEIHAFAASIVEFIGKKERVLLDKLDVLIEENK